MPTWWQLGKALQMELGHRPLLEEPCPQHSAARNCLPCTLHQNLSHSLPRKHPTYLRHSRSSNTIHVDRDTASRCSRSPSQDLSWVHPYPFVLLQRKSWKPGLGPLSLGLPRMWLPSSCWVFQQPAICLSFPSLNPIPVITRRPCPGPSSAHHHSQGGINAPGCPAPGWGIGWALAAKPCPRGSHHGEPPPSPGNPCPRLSSRTELGFCFGSSSCPVPSWRFSDHFSLQALPFCYAVSNSTLPLF